MYKLPRTISRTGGGSTGAEGTGAAGGVAVEGAGDDGAEAEAGAGAGVDAPFGAVATGCGDAGDTGMAADCGVSCLAVEGAAVGCCETGCCEVACSDGGAVGTDSVFAPTYAVGFIGAGCDFGSAASMSLPGAGCGFADAMGAGFAAAGVAGLAAAGAASSAGLPSTDFGAEGLASDGAVGTISAMLSLRIMAKPYAVSTLKEPSSKPTMLPVIFEPSLRRISSARTPAASAKSDRAAQRTRCISRTYQRPPRAARNRGNVVPGWALAGKYPGRSPLRAGLVLVG